MRPLTLFCILIFSCSQQRPVQKESESETETVHVESDQKSEAKLENLETEVVFEFTMCKKYGKFVNAMHKKNKIALTENLRTEELLPVNDDFYFNYIEDSEIMIPRPGDEGRYEVEHYFWDVKETSEICLVIILERHLVNLYEDRLFAFGIDQEGEGLFHLQVGEETLFPGAHKEMFSRLVGNELRIYDVIEYIGDPTNDGTNSYEYQKDSTQMTFKILSTKLELLDSLTTVLNYIK